MENQLIWILGAVVVIVVIIVFIMTDKKPPKTKETGKGEVDKEEEKIFAKKAVPMVDIVNFMEFDKISDDMIIQKGGNVYTMVVQCKGINYDLMSEIEQMAVEEGFITFLNTLRCPIQIYVQARAVDLRSSMRIYKEKIDDIELQCKTYEQDLKKAIQEPTTSHKDLFDAQLNYQKYSNMFSYANDITNYVEKMSSNKQMLQRKFYIIFSYNKSEITNLEKFTPQEITQMCYTELYTRARSIISALQACSVSGEVIDSNQLAELLYISYNRDDEKIIDVKQALSSEFYRLYSTSKDIEEKKDEVLSKEYQKESSKRLQQMITEGLAKGSLPIAGEQAASEEADVDKLAMKYVAEADIDLETKDALTKIIIKKHIDRAERVKEEERERQAKLRQEEFERAAAMQQRQVVQQQQVQRPVATPPQAQQVTAQPNTPQAPQASQVQEPQVAKPLEQVVKQPQIVTQQGQVARPLEQVIKQPQATQPQVARPLEQVIKQQPVQSTEISKEQKLEEMRNNNPYLNKEAVTNNNNEGGI
ncbi:MAG: hypothetical protein RR922_00840 [Clostridia bacterium]